MDYEKLLRTNHLRSTLYADILRQVEQEAKTCSQIASALGRPPQAIYGKLHTLCAINCLTKDSQRRYYVLTNLDVTRDVDTIRAHEIPHEIGAPIGSLTEQGETRDLEKMLSYVEDFDFPFEYQIHYAGTAEPIRDANGELDIYKGSDIHNRRPRNRDFFADPEYEPMCIYGVPANELEFCTFSVAKQHVNGSGRVLNLPEKMGVYFWVLENTVIYIGRAAREGANLRNRFRGGYSSITNNRVCVRHRNTSGAQGQATNIRMNSELLQYWRAHRVMHIYYLQTDSAEEAIRVESELIARNMKRNPRPIPPRDPIYTCMYNKRH